jgi:hypothetical protein
MSVHMSRVRPRNADDLTSAELATAAIDMDHVLEAEPLLSDNGLKYRGLDEQDFIRWREDIRAPRSLAQFMAARSWLGRFRKIKAPNRRGTSYGLKHCAEDDIGYSTNGVFIAAAIAEGFKICRSGLSSPNVWLNVSTEAWRYTERERDARQRREYAARHNVSGARL